MKIWIVRRRDGTEFMRVRAVYHDEIVIESNDISRLPGKYSFALTNGKPVKDVTLFVNSHTGSVYYCGHDDEAAPEDEDPDYVAYVNGTYIHGGTEE